MSEDNGITENLPPDEKLNLLIHFNTQIKAEVDFLRERQDKIFTWTSGILMALIGALLIVEPSKNPVWSTQIGSKAIVSVAVAVFVILSVIWQQRVRRIHGENGQVILKIEKLLHCFDEGYFGVEVKEGLFHPRWNKSPETKIPSFLRRVFAANYVSATLLLGILTIALIWIRG